MEGEAHVAGVARPGTEADGAPILDADDDAAADSAIAEAPAGERLEIEWQPSAVGARRVIAAADSPPSYLAGARGDAFELCRAVLARRRACRSSQSARGTPTATASSPSARAPPTTCRGACPPPCFAPQLLHQCPVTALLRRRVVPSPDRVLRNVAAHALGVRRPCVPGDD
jgi:hypothetical protein